MPETTVTRTIPHPRERVWAVLSDFAGTAVWNPEVLTSESVNGLRTGLGARRRCEFDPAGAKWTEEQIVFFDEEATRYVLKIEGGTAAPPIDDVRAELAAEALGPDQTLVTARVTLNGVGPKQRVVALAGKVALRRVFERVLAGLAHHLDTGGPIRDTHDLEVKSVRA